MIKRGKWLLERPLSPLDQRSGRLLYGIVDSIHCVLPDAPDPVRGSRDATDSVVVSAIRHR